ncbi:pentapeptide repeat-containing protein [Agromyces bauzanensis]
MAKRVRRASWERELLGAPVWWVHLKSRWSRRQAILTSDKAVLVYIILSAALIVIATWIVPQWIVAGDAEVDGSAQPLTTAERVDAITTTRQLMLIAAGGLLAVIGIIFTWRRDRTARALADLDRDANFTTRYTEAIAQLGDEASLAIRLGGIYALERIAADSIRDRQTILSVLTAFLRVRNPVGSENFDERKIARPLDADTEAAATVVARITQGTPPNIPLSLARTYLPGAYLAYANLSDGDLSSAYLVGADLTGAILGYTDLTTADLQFAVLVDAHLAHARLSGADLTEADLTGADLTGADLRDVDMTNANLTGAELTGARFGSTTVWPEGYAPTAPEG